MKHFPNGVAFYTSGQMQINFPENDCVCRHCICLQNDYNLDRAKCLRTGEIIPAPDYMRGHSCPIVFEEDGENESV